MWSGHLSPSHFNPMSRLHVIVSFIVRSHSNVSLGGERQALATWVRNRVSIQIKNWLPRSACLYLGKFPISACIPAWLTVI